MEALVCVRPGELSLEQRESPTAGSGEALVRTRRVGLCGTDYHIFEGSHPFLNYPRVIGHELAVEVVSAPSGSGLRAGDICVVNPYLSCGHCVACRAGKPNACVTISVLGVHQDGGMTSEFTLPAGNLIPANGLSIDECATVEFLAIGAHAVRRAAVQSGDRVLVVGAGPIGLGAALFASLDSNAVTVTDLDADRSRAARELLGVSILDVETDSPAATFREAFDVVFDATGSRASMLRSFDYVAHGGRYVLVSVVKGPISVEDADFHRREMTLLASRNATSTDFARVMSAIRMGKVPVDRLITHRTSLANAVQDIPVWANEKRGLIKALIEIGDGEPAADVASDMIEVRAQTGRGRP
ncbi:MAG: zinc-binding alcohol dehydrogenase family protein [Devosia sp.]